MNLNCLNFKAKLSFKVFLKMCLEVSLPFRKFDKYFPHSPTTARSIQHYFVFRVIKEEFAR